MTVTIALAGDTMLGRGVAEQITRQATAGGAGGLFSAGVRELAASADLTVLNLECCISCRGRPWDHRPFHFRAPPQAASLLAGLGVDCVTLANNHALDFGYAALTDTLAHLSQAGISVTGAGADLAAARAPAVLHAGGLSVAVLGVTDHPADYAAAPGRPGVAYADLRAGGPGWLTEKVRALAAANDAVVVTPHWGPNMATWPRPYIRSAASALTGAGATLVAGHSAHLFQGVTGRVLYDLGDFIDDYVTYPALRNDLGLLFLVTIGEHRQPRVEAVPLKLRYARTELAAGADRDWIRARFTRACAALGSCVHDHGGRLTVTAEPVPSAPAT